HPAGQPRFARTSLAAYRFVRAWISRPVRGRIQVSIGPASSDLSTFHRTALMDLFVNLQLGLSEALTLQNLLFCLLGALIGTLVGVLPGIGPLATVAMLLPITYSMPPVT